MKPCVSSKTGNVWLYAPEIGFMKQQGHKFSLPFIHHWLVKNSLLHVFIYIMYVLNLEQLDKNKAADIPDRALLEKQY